jgi:hypothetical protein
MMRTRHEIVSNSIPVSFEVSARDLEMPPTEDVHSVAAPSSMSALSAEDILENIRNCPHPYQITEGMNRRMLDYVKAHPSPTPPTNDDTSNTDGNAQ